jgi:hypothetical protein
MDNQYRTSDVYYAAYLKVAGVPFLGTEREGNRVYFLFEAIEGLKDLKAQYFNRTAKVSALNFADEIRSMKTMTYE